MNGNVHMAVGAATATGIALIMPEMQDIKMLPIGIGVAVFASVLPDIDANGDSKAKKMFRHFMSITLIALIAIIAYSFILGLSIIDYFSKANILQIFAIGGFFLCCILGYLSNHRCYTHRWYGLVSFTLCFYIMFGLPLTYWFFAGFFSHQIIDMLNKKKILWLYPLPVDFARYVCKADSKLSTLIGTISVTLAVLFTGLIIIL